MPNWSDFQLHFMCNLDTECAGGEDELDCPYTGFCGVHKLTIDGRCYQLFRNKLASWNKASYLCARFVVFDINTCVPVQIKLHPRQVSSYLNLAKHPCFTGTVKDRHNKPGERGECSSISHLHCTSQNDEDYLRRCCEPKDRYYGGRRPSSDDSLHSPTVIPPSALKSSIMKRYHRRRTTK